MIPVEVSNIMPSSKPPVSIGPKTSVAVSLSTLVGVIVVTFSVAAIWYNLPTKEESKLAADAGDRKVERLALAADAEHEKEASKRFDELSDRVGSLERTTRSTNRAVRRVAAMLEVDSTPRARRAGKRWELEEIDDEEN